MQWFEPSSSMSNFGTTSLRGIGLSNTIHSEVAPCLPLPSLPVFCGAYDQELCLFDEPRNSRSLNRRDVVSQASRIADLLRETDVSYLWVILWISKILTKTVEWVDSFTVFLLPLNIIFVRMLKIMDWEGEISWQSNLISFNTIALLVMLVLSSRTELCCFAISSIYLRSFKSNILSTGGVGVSLE